jgi:hypothetical protein
MNCLLKRHPPKASKRCVACEVDDLNTVVLQVFGQLWKRVNPVFVVLDF